jgi:hypothetical protein
LLLNNNASCTCCLTEHKTWRKNYEIYLDNLIKQTLDDLQLQEAIRGEYTKLEMAYFNNTNQNNDSQMTTKTNGFCTTSNSWTFDRKLISDKEVESLLEKDLNFQTFTRLKDLLSDQQRRQMSLIDELSHLAFSLKMTDTINNSNKSFISKVEVNMVNNGDRSVSSMSSSNANDDECQNLILNRTQMHLILNHSENSLTNINGMCYECFFLNL